jgi:hypothetical protein
MQPSARPPQVEGHEQLPPATHREGSRAADRADCTPDEHRTHPQVDARPSRAHQGSGDEADREVCRAGRDGFAEHMDKRSSDGTTRSARDDSTEHVVRERNDVVQPGPHGSVRFEYAAADFA